VLYIILTRISRGFQISNLKFEIQPVAADTVIFVFQPHFRKIWDPLIRAIHISSWLYFQGEFESGHRNLKFSLWQLLQLYWCFSHIVGKCDLHQLGWSRYHLDQIFEGVLNLKSEIWNSISGTCYGNICVLVTFLEHLMSTNQVDLYTILIGFLKRFWIWNQTHQIQPVPFTFGMFVLDIYFQRSIMLDILLKLCVRHVENIYICID